MRKRIEALAVAVVIGLGAGACATGQSQAGLETEPASTTVTVGNNNWLDVNMYVVRGGTRHRLGTVTSMNSRTFRIPRSMAVSGQVQLLADPIGSNERYVTEPILVNEGGHVDLTLENRLALSNYSAW